jgi:tetratricopeptide (TPR) repeat protein
VEVTAQSALPPLPRLALESYAPSTRAAISRVSREAAARPTDPGAVGALGRVLHAWEQWHAAHQAYARAQALAPRAFEWHYLAALVLQRLARHQDAAQQFEKALGIAPDYLPARVKLAEALFDAGELDESGTRFEDLLREAAAEPSARFGLGRIDAAHNRHEAAIRHLERAIALFPEWGAAHYALAQAYRATGRPDDAERALQQHARYGPRWPGIADPVLATVTALRDDAHANLQRGLKLAEAGDLEGAISAHEAALSRDPSVAQAHANLINLYGRAGKWTEAEKHYRAAVALGVGLADVHYDYGVLLGLQEKWDMAAQAYRDAIAVNPEHARAHNNLGHIHERSRAFDNAAVAYRRAVDARPTFRLARFNLGRMLVALGRTQEAIAELAKLRQPRDAETARYLFALATAHVRAGQKAEGVKWAIEARQLALEYQQHDLAAVIDRDLAALK